MILLNIQNMRTKNYENVICTKEENWQKRNRLKKAKY